MQKPASASIRFEQRALAAEKFDQKIARQCDRQARRRLARRRRLGEENAAEAWVAAAEEMRQQGNAMTGARGARLRGLAVGAQYEPAVGKMPGEPERLGKMRARFVEADEDRIIAGGEAASPILVGVKSEAERDHPPGDQAAVVGPGEAQR